MGVSGSVQKIVAKEDMICVAIFISDIRRREESHDEFPPPEICTNTGLD
jgi:hypothetical protein